MRNLLHIERGEWGKVLALFSYLFLVVGIGIAGKAARDSYFLSRYDRSLLPIMLVACAASVVLVMAVYARLAKWWGQDALFHVSNAVFAGSLVLISLRIQGWVIPFLYVWVDVVTEVAGLQFWVLALEILNSREAKRLLGPIGAGSAMAGVVVGFGLKPFVRAFGSGALLYLAAGMVAASWGMGLVARRYLQAGPAVKKERPRPPRGRLDPYIAAIAVIVAGGAVASLLVDYQFKMIAARSIASEGGLAAFFGQFYAMTGVASLAVQLLLSSVVFSRYGVLAGLLILPVMMNVGSLAILLRTTLFSAAFTKGSDQTFKHTLNRAAMELLWLPVPPQRRQAMRPLLSGSLKCAAEGVAGLTAFFLVKVVRLEWLSLIAIAASGIWIYACIRMRPLYAQALARAISRRQLDFEELTVDVKDPAMVAIVSDALEKGDAAQQLFVLDLIAGLSLEPWAEMLRRLLREGPAEVRRRIAAVAVHDREVLPDAWIAKAMAEQGPVTAQAILAAGERGSYDLLPEVAASLKSGSAEVREAAAAVILRWKRGPTDLARAVLESVVLDLEDAAKTLAARRALACFEAKEVVPFLATALGDASATAKIGIVRALRKYPGDEAVGILLGAIDRENLGLYEEIADALLEIARKGPFGVKARATLARQRAELIRAAYGYNRILCLLPAGGDAFLLRSWLETALARTVLLVLKLGAVSKPQTPIEGCIRILQAEDRTRLPFVLELLDGIFPHAERASIYPLVESIPMGERDRVGAARYADLPADLGAVLAGLAIAANPWESAIALDYLWRTRAEVLHAIAWEQVPDSALIRELRERWSEEHAKTMYSTLEKTIFLKSVDLFGKIPAETLSRIAQVTEEKLWVGGTPIVRDGDEGSSMYVVVEGSVRIHKGGRELAVLGKGGCFGEMSLLDGSPRSADATACEDSTLLEIQEDSFYEVLSGDVEIAQGIIRMLTDRLREANRKLAEVR